MTTGAAILPESLRRRGPASMSPDGRSRLLGLDAAPAGVSLQLTARRDHDETPRSRLLGGRSPAAASGARSSPFDRRGGASLSVTAADVGSSSLSTRDGAPSPRASAPQHGDRPSLRGVLPSRVGLDISSSASASSPSGTGCAGVRAVCSGAPSPSTTRSNAAQALESLWSLDPGNVDALEERMQRLREAMPSLAASWDVVAAELPSMDFDDSYLPAAQGQAEPEPEDSVAEVHPAAFARSQRVPPANDVSLDAIFADFRNGLGSKFEELERGMETLGLDHQVLGAPAGKKIDGGYSDRCAICLELFGPGEELRILPCLHRYHAACVDPWLRARNRSECPLCRHRV